jgi:UDP-N-acetylglucosamine 4-epimerase
MGAKVVVTGGAGFIGSHLTERLLNDPRVEKVLVLDDLSNGDINNLDEFKGNPKLQFEQADICDYEHILSLTKGYDLMSHQAALGSVPRSIKDPMRSNLVNVGGTVNVLFAAVQNGISRVILACSSSTYGDSKALPKVEGQIGRPLSPYAVSKYAVELYADVFNKNYGLDYVGLRYFNVFGPKQSPDNPYAAVIPLFMKAFREGKQPVILGDGETSRDFTYVDNAVEANMLALFSNDSKALNQVYNVACGEQTSLNQTIAHLQKLTGKKLSPIYQPERVGDVRHSKADISKITELLNYRPKVFFKEGLEKTFNSKLKP